MLTVENTNKYFPESDEIVKCYINHQRQQVRSTKNKNMTEPNTSNEVGKTKRNMYAKVMIYWMTRK